MAQFLFDSYRGAWAKSASVIVLLVALLASCAPGATGRGEGALVEELAAYDTVVVPQIVEDGGARDRYGLESLLVRELESAGFNAMTESEAIQVGVPGLRTLMLGVSYFWTPAGYGSYATVNLVLRDALGAEIYRTQGTHAGLSLAADAQGAARKAAAQIASAYPGYQQEAKSNVQRRVDSWSRGLATEGEVKSNLSAGNRSLDPIEGIWTSEDGRFSLGIYRVTTTPGVDFVGTVVAGGHDEWVWRNGMVRLEATKTAVAGRYTVRYWSNQLEVVGRTLEVRDSSILIPGVPGFLGGAPTDEILVKAFPVETTQATAPEPGGRAEGVASGSGFLLSESGLVATNAHVIEGATTITVHLNEGKASYRAQVLLNDVDNDLAVLQLLDFDFGAIFRSPIPYTLGDSNTAAVGQDVLAFGFPLSNLLGSSVRVTNGIISSRSGLQNAPNVFQISNPVQPGNSGGPLLNSYGEVVGIVVASLDEGFVLGASGALPQNVNFAVKSAYLRNLVSMLPEGGEVLNRASQPDAMTSDRLVSETTPFMALIHAE